MFSIQIVDSVLPFQRYTLLSILLKYTFYIVPVTEDKTSSEQTAAVLFQHD